MNAAQRLKKRVKREHRKSKDTTWFCAGCGDRHPKGERCPIPRLFAKGFNRVKGSLRPAAEVWE